MKKLLLLKLSVIQKEMKEMETMHLFHLNSTWEKLRSKELLLLEIMADYEESERKPYLQDIAWNYERGLITDGEKDAMLLDIQNKVIDY